MLKNFEEHCNPRENTIFERYRFQCRNQEAGETGSLPDGVTKRCRKLRFRKYYNQSDNQGPFRTWHERLEGPREVTSRETSNSRKSLRDGTSS